MSGTNSRLTSVGRPWVYCKTTVRLQQDYCKSTKTMYLILRAYSSFLPRDGSSKSEQRRLVLRTSREG